MPEPVTPQRLREMLPAYYDGDPLVARFMRAFAGELDRLRRFVEALRDQSVPAATSDERGLLSRWEAMLDLPVAPAGKTEQQRRDQVVAKFRARRVGAGTKWRAAMDAAVGVGNWQAEPNTPGPYQLLITIPYSAGSFPAGRVEEIARAITPAHIEIVVAYDEGFLVGPSEVGEAI